MTPSRKRRPYAPRLPPAQRREQLLDAALEIIARDGYAGVSVDAIAREIGAARSVVYGVFDSLQDLLYALLDRQEQRALQQLLTAIPHVADAGDLPAFALSAVRNAAATVAADPRTWRPILLPPEGTPKPVQQRIERAREMVRVRIRELLRQALAPTGASATDADFAAHATIALAEYFGRLIVEDPGFDRDGLVAALEVLLRASAGARHRVRKSTTPA